MNTTQVAVKVQDLEAGNPLGPGLSDNGSAPAESGVHTNMWFSPNAPVAYHDITFRNGQTLVARIEK